MCQKEEKTITDQPKYKTCKHSTGRVGGAA